MKAAFFVAGAALCFCSCLIAEETHGPLERHYQEGETLVYKMKATNDGNQYEAKSTGVVKKDSSGDWIEEFAWSGLVWGGQPITLPQGSTEFRQILSLDPSKNPAVPNLAVVDPKLIGPITDLLTFYADLWLAERTGKLKEPGDHFYFERGTPNSWADGNFVILGQDAIDFDMTLTQVTLRKATLLVRHVPPAKPQISMPAEWMRSPVADTANNWVNVVHAGSNYIAQVGKETFDVQLTISLTDGGKIVSGTIKNPIEARERICQDAELKTCGDAYPRKILREIQLDLVP